MSDTNKKQSGVRNLLNNELSSGLPNLDNILNPHANKQQEEKTIIPEKPEHNVGTNENITFEEEQEEQKHSVPAKKIKKEVTRLKPDLATVNLNTTLEELMDLVFKRREEKSKDYALNGYILPHLYKKLNVLCEIRDVSTKEAISNILELFFTAHAAEIEKEVKEYMLKSFKL